MIWLILALIILVVLGTGTVFVLMGVYAIYRTSRWLYDNDCY